MMLAVRARWFALAVIAVMLPFVNFRFEMIYYEVLLILFALNGWAQLRAATVERSGLEVILLLFDLVLMTIVVVVPNPLGPMDWPTEMQYRFHTHQYFYIFLAFGTLAYSWRTVRGYASMAALIWGGGALIVWLMQPDAKPFTDLIYGALPDNPRMAEVLDPQNIRFDVRLQEVVIFFLVAMMLSLTVRRFSDLLLDHASLERERTNLARYFSPNVVEELSHNDEPLKQVRTQDIAVLFVDIVGFTAFAADKSPEEVIQTLRAFHKRMEAEVFRHHGTLDKYLGDGLMATFGTPVAGDRDALNALTCAQAMAAVMAKWNLERAAAGEPAITASFGLHYGPAVLGDLGGDNRLEFAVIGNTVNIASRVEALTRTLGVQIALTAEMAQKIIEESADDRCLHGFAAHEGCEIRGVDERMSIWGAPPVN
jgi:adenylate cyclase